MYGAPNGGERELAMGVYPSGSPYADDIVAAGGVLTGFYGLVVA